MKFCQVISLLCCFVTAAHAAANLSLVSLLPLVPPCALNCLAFEIPPAALTDAAVFCTNTTTQISLSACSQQRCNHTEQTVVGILQHQLCEGYPAESRSWSVAVGGMVCGGLIVIVVGLRIYSRITIAKKLGADDWLMLAATVVVIVLGILDVYNCLANGFGHHIWNIDPIQNVQLLKIFYACEILYLVSMTLTKASILMLYMRIFRATWFRIANIGALVLVIAIGLATSLAGVFQCVPISGVWNPQEEATCVNVNALAFASGLLVVLTDIIILLLPVPELVQLRMSWRKKFRIFIMFALGSVACITSMVRLKYLVNFAKSNDPSFDNSTAVIWTYLEVTVAMTCACLPAIRTLLSRIAPTLFALTRGDPSKPTTPNNMSAPLTRLSRLEKQVPIYKKWSVGMRSNDSSPGISPLSEVFQMKGKDAKIWINPKFNDTGELVDFCAVDMTLHETEMEMRRSFNRVSTHSIQISLRALDGPRSSDVARTLHMDMGQQSNRDSRLDGEEAEEEMETDDEADERDLDVSNNVFEKDLDLEAGEEDEEMREFQSTPRVRKVSQGRPMMRMSSIPLPMGQNAQSGWA